MMKGLLTILILGGGILLAFEEAVYADCSPVTGNPTIDQTCCVNPQDTSFGTEQGESTHGSYLACVAEVAIDLQLAGEITEAEADEIISDKAANSGVNK